MKKKDKKLIIAIIIFLIIFGYNLYKEQEFSSNALKPDTNIVTSDLNIYFLDVGQADSILISNNNTNMLIDAGNNEDGDLLVDYIKEELNISKLDIVVGTHPHEDHIGGLDDIINNIDVEEVYLPEVITTTKTFEDVLDAIEKNKLEITVPEIDSSFKLGEAEFKVLYTGTDDSDLNNTSIVLKMTYGKYNYLFTGDATDKVEKLILNKNIKADVLKVGHHGSAYSSTEEFLTKVGPKYAIISCASKNSYGHPSPETITRLEQTGAKIYNTKDLGTIHISSDGDKININNFKTNTNG